MTTNILVLAVDGFDVEVKTFDSDVLTDTHVVKGPGHWQTYITTTRHLVISETASIHS